MKIVDPSKYGGMGQIFMGVATLVLIFVVTPAVWRYASSLQSARSLAVSAEGEVLAIPDIAESSFSVVVQGKNPQDLAQNSNEKMAAVVEFLKSKNIDSKDIKTTAYNLYPDYEYDENIRRSFITGYTITQTVTVKIRDLGRAAEIIAGLTPLGVNQIGGINFTIDDPENYLTEARGKAFEKAKAKAKSIAAQSGARLGRVLNVSESSGGFPPPIPYFKDARLEALGGAVSAPTLEPGSQEVKVQVTIVYELR